MQYRSRVTVRLHLSGLIVLCLFWGCAGGYRVETEIDDDGATTNTTVGNELWVVGGTKDYPTDNSRTITRRCFLDLRRCEDQQGRLSYSLVFEYVGLEELKFDSRSPLELTMDEKTVTLSEGSHAKRRRDGRHIVDCVEYPIHRSVLQRLAKAEEAKMTISGDYGSLTAYFRENNLAIVRRFTDGFVESKR